MQKISFSHSSKTFGFCLKLIWRFLAWGILGQAPPQWTFSYGRLKYLYCKDYLICKAKIVFSVPLAHWFFSSTHRNTKVTQTVYFVCVFYSCLLQWGICPNFVLNLNIIFYILFKCSRKAIPSYFSRILPKQ